MLQSNKEFCKPKQSELTVGRPKSLVSSRQFCLLVITLIDFLMTDWLYIMYLERKVFYVCPKLVISHKVLDFGTETESKLQRKNVKEYVVRTAAKIVREDIQKMKYDCCKYPSEEEVSTS